MAINVTFRKQFEVFDVFVESVDSISGEQRRLDTFFRVFVGQIYKEGSQWCYDTQVARALRCHAPYLRQA